MTFLLQSSDATTRLAALGRELEGMGYLRFAEWVYRRLTRLKSPSSTSFYLLGRLQMQRGKLQEAKRNLALGLELKPDFYQCRVSFFDLCRLEYWTGLSAKGARPEDSVDATGLPPEQQLRRIHRLLARAASQQVWYEIARFDSDDPDLGVFARLEAMLEGTRGRAARGLARQLEVFRQGMEDVKGLLAAPKGDGPMRRVRITRRKLPPLEVVALRDGDDLVGPHLEVISAGELSFLGLTRLYRISFGLHSDYTETALYFVDGSRLNVVVPTTYYSSRFSALTELTRGEISIFKELYHGIQVGVGRRVFRAIMADTREPVAISITEIDTIEFH